MESVLQNLANALASIWAFLNLKPIVFVEGAISLKFVESMFDRYKDRKRLSINLYIGEPIKHNVHRTSLEVKNIGAKDLGIRAYGYKTWIGEQVYQKYHTVMMNELLKPEHEPIMLAFYDSTNGVNISVPHDDVFFYFVETGSKVFRKYTRPLFWAWAKRIKIWLLTNY